MIPKKQWYFDEISLRLLKDECEYLCCSLQDLYYLKAIDKLESIEETVNNLHVVVVNDD